MIKENNDDIKTTYEEFLNSISRETKNKVLSKKEEQELFKKIELSKDIDLNYILTCKLTEKQKHKLIYNNVFTRKELSEYNGYIIEDNIDLYIELLCDKEKARKKLFIYNQKLVIFLAEKYKKEGFDVMDLIMEGNIGLNRAIDTYEYKRNLHFSNYAIRCIRTNIYIITVKKDNLVPFSNCVGEDMVMLQKELSEIDSLTITEEMIIKQEEINELYSILHILLDKEKEMILLKYGFTDEKNVTCKSLQRRFDCSKQTIYSREKKILQKIKKEMV